MVLTYLLYLPARGPLVSATLHVPPVSYFVGTPLVILTTTSKFIVSVITNIYTIFIFIAGTTTEYGH